jgi:hypothetical protein
LRAPKSKEKDEAYEASLPHISIPPLMEFLKSILPIQSNEMPLPQILCPVNHSSKSINPFRITRSMTGQLIFHRASNTSSLDS